MQDLALEHLPKTSPIIAPLNIVSRLWSYYAFLRMTHYIVVSLTVVGYHVTLATDMFACFDECIMCDSQLYWHFFLILEGWWWGQ